MEREIVLEYDCKKCVNFESLLCDICSVKGMCDAGDCCTCFVNPPCDFCLNNYYEEYEKGKV